VLEAASFSVAARFRNFSFKEDSVRILEQIAFVSGNGPPPYSQRHLPPNSFSFLPGVYRCDECSQVQA
jgi:hypothetical protein